MVFPVPFSWSFSFSAPIILSFGLFMVSQIFWMFGFKNLLDLTFSVTNESASCIVSSTTEILPYISLILLVMLASVVPVYLPRCSISRIRLVCVFLSCLFSSFQILNCLNSLHHLLGIFLDFVDFR